MWLLMMQVTELLQLLWLTQKMKRYDSPHFCTLYIKITCIIMYIALFQVVGLAAKQSRIRNISNTVMKVKQILGRRYGIK